MTTKPIVVGVDGSPGSVAALRWALTEAALHQTTVRAVSCWSLPAMYGVDIAATSALDPNDIAGEAARSLHQAVTEALAGNPAPSLDEVVIPGLPSQVLVHESEDADMVVVGARGHGGFMGLLLGSVATQVVNHAKCPVVVVPKAATHPEEA